MTVQILVAWKKRFAQAFHEAAFVEGEVIDDGAAQACGMEVVGVAYLVAWAQEAFAEEFPGVAVVASADAADIPAADLGEKDEDQEAEEEHLNPWTSEEAVFDLLEMTRQLIKALQLQSQEWLHFQSILDQKVQELSAVQVRGNRQATDHQEQDFVHHNLMQLYICCTWKFQMNKRFCKIKSDKNLAINF